MSRGMPGIPQIDDYDEYPLMGDKRLREARKRYQRCAEWEAWWRPLFISDVKFANADSDNGYQWDSALRAERGILRKPCLTMNVTRVHNKQITNSALRNKTSVKVVGAGNGATEESAQMMQAVVEKIQYQSDAQSAFEMARQFQVDGGIGYWRIVTDYVPDSVDEQDIFIQSIRDPLSVYLDPAIRMKNGSDARFGFIFDTVPKAEFKEAYPRFADKATLSPMGIGAGADDWLNDNEVRICEYFRMVPKKDTLVSFRHPGTGTRHTLRKSQLGKEMLQPILSDSFTRTREAWVNEVEWMLIVGDEIIDETVWPGSYIPIIRCVGEEMVIDGRLDRKGHTRHMKDAQRMLNYNASASVEFGALQSKVPWYGAADSIEDMEDYWNTANTENHSFLPFKHLDKDGNPIPPQALPQRMAPPQTSPVFETGMQTAFNQMMMTSGQWQNQLGMMGNERTGEAIEKRQDQGDNATYHFANNFDNAIVFTGVQLIDLVPKVFDTKRILRCQADDGVEFDLEIDPTLRQSYFQHISHDGEVVKRLFNPQLGKYDVRAVPGQAFGSRREETVQALTLILTQAPGLTGIIGDLLLSAMDFKEAKEAAQRLKRMVPNQALGTGPSQEMQQAHLQITQLQAALAEALQKLGKEQLKVSDKAELRDIEVYRSQTERMKALADAKNPQEFQQAISDLVKQAAETHITPMLKANQPDVDDIGKPPAEGPDTRQLPTPNRPPPMPGATLAPDGEWYLRDPTRKGKYLKLAPLAEQRAPAGERPGENN